jgi:hypothetical protein
MRSFLFFVVAFGGLGLLGGIAWASKTPEANEARGSVLLHLALEDGRLTVVSARLLDSPVRARTVRPGPDTRYRIVLVSESERVLYETGIPDPFELRGEWPAQDGSGRIEGVHLRRTGRVDFSVRIPASNRATLRLLGVPEHTPRMAHYKPQSFSILGQTTLPRQEAP